MTQRAIRWPSISLEPIQTSDAEIISGWQNDPEVRDLNMGFRAPVNRDTTADWIRGLRDQNLKTRVAFAIHLDGNIKGVINLHTLDFVHRSGMLGVFIGDISDRGAGLGWAATSILLDYGFNGLDLQRVSLQVIASNAPAIRLYQGLGFVREGSLRSAYFRAGKREDVELYALLRQELTPLPGAARRLLAPATIP